MPPGSTCPRTTKSCGATSAMPGSSCLTTYPEDVSDPSAIELADLTESLCDLDELSRGEFRAGISDILPDPDEFLAFKRLGRLAAVPVKGLFATPKHTTLTFPLTGRSQAGPGRSSNRYRRF